MALHGPIAENAQCSMLCTEKLPEILTDRPDGNLIGSVLRGAYRIQSVLRDGSAFTIYEAEHLRLARRVAVKCVSLNAREDETLAGRFAKEVETLCLFRHPHIVAVLDWDKTADGRWYAVMEFLAGKTLLQHIHERTKLTTEQVIEIVLQIGGALGLAHASGVVHGAIVPANVFLLADCEHVCVKLFGFAAEAQSRASMTSDQYSLATILYELLTKRPLTGAPSKRGLPQELSAVVLRALSRDQKDRYRSVQSFCAALRHAVGLVRPNSALVGLAAGDERPHFELPAAGLSLARTSAPTQPGGDWGRRAAKSLEADIELARREAKSGRVEEALGSLGSVIAKAESNQSPLSEQILGRSVRALRAILREQCGQRQTRVESVRLVSALDAAITPEDAYLLSLLEKGMRLDSIEDVSPMGAPETWLRITRLVTSGLIVTS